jgi:hypothetical protein
MTERDDKARFIGRLRHFAATNGADTPDGYGRIGYRPGRGLTVLAVGIAQYLDDPAIPGPSLGLNWLRDLPLYLTEAFRAFRESPRWDDLRRVYREHADHEIPSLVNIHEGGLHRSMVAHDIVRLVPILADAEWLAARLAEHVNAQWGVVTQAWQDFLRVIYREVMPRIKAETHCGEFGATTLLSFACAGRVMFTFNRGDDSLTYVADDSDMYGARSGPNATATPYERCVAMIRDVVDGWGMERFARSDSVGIG